MVRKYNPEVKTEYGVGLFSDDAYHEAVMKESENGQWVKLETFLDETARLRAMIIRLQNENAALKGSLEV